MVNPEWSHKVDIHNLDDGVHKYNIAANEQERSNLARRFSVKTIESLTADIIVTKIDGSHIIEVSGRFEASLTQTCVISGKDVQKDCSGDLEAWFRDNEDVISLDKIRRDRDTVKNNGETPISDEKNDPEPLDEGHIDVAEVAAQFLSLSIDPFPKAEDADDADVSAYVVDEPEEKQALHNPFAALKEWKNKNDKK